MPHRVANQARDRVFERVAAIVDALGGEIEALGELLCSDPAVSARFAHQLQAIDVIAQKQRQLASIIAASEIHDAIANLSLDELRTALTDVAA